MNACDFFDPAALESRLRRETLVRHLEFRTEVGSTNDLALRMAAEEGRPTPWLVLAERQTGGRGRGGNRWWSADGGLTFSLVVSAEDLSLAVRDWPRVALMTGLAVCEAVAPLVPAAAIRVKWPNDVLLDGRKLCGILVETAGPRPGRVVIGVGINVNTMLADAPPDVRARATSLCEATGRPHDRGDVLVRFLQRLAWERDQITAATLAARWQARCALHGEIVEIESAGRRVTGRCRGIDADGALVLETETGRQRIVSGIVLRWGD